ncbi:hypothetical protein [Bradyrhizobium sp. th.b2]|uniref:hypothetical protein n=1 Tax=Bradyrhizobium sp. th-b2 TaxID=172088 RepID=UPI00041048A0|nr:hypothetical protein [Bradyrhizobium sp. th.b2]
MTTPYSRATSTKAREDVTMMLRRFGCEQIGFMDDFADHSVLLAFTHRGRQVQLRASAKGWAALHLKANPWSRSRKLSQAQWERAALDQGMIAVNSILRDWTKAQVTAIETGLMSFEAVFAVHMLLPDGRPVLERIAALTGIEHQGASP